jgi:uncharacterized protein YjaZ
MKFNILDTEAIYRRMLDEPDAARRGAIFRQEIIAPFGGLVPVFGGGDELAMFAQWGMRLDLFDDEHREETRRVLDALAAADAWGETAEALDEGHKAFAACEDQIALDGIVFALVVADMSHNPLDRGYTGFGGLPGYIMTVYSQPNDYNLPRIKGTTVHEMHHNVRFTLFPFSMMVSVGEYIIAEGLAESFSAELYGEDQVGYYVTEFNDAELETAKNVIGGALDKSGFNVVRGYIFGDTLAETMGFPKAGVPNYAGYAIGYRIVQQYLKRTGKTVAEATFFPAKDIIAQSGFFD